jgi:copper transport protein
MPVIGWMLWLVVLAVVAAVATLGGIPSAFAHAGYDRSTPGDGEVLAEAPSRVDVYFAQQVARSGGLPTLIVVNEAGDQVDTGAVLDDDDRTHMSAELEDGLGDGRYTVIWHTLSADDDEEAQGAFHFYIGSGPSTGPTSSAGPTTTPSAPADENDDDGGVPGWLLIAGIAGGLVVGVGGGLALGRRSGG